MVSPDQIPPSSGMRFQCRQRQIIAAALTKYPQANGKLSWVVREALECLATRDHLLEEAKEAAAIAAEDREVV